MAAVGINEPSDGRIGGAVSFFFFDDQRHPTETLGGCQIAGWPGAVAFVSINPYLVTSAGSDDGANVVCGR